MRTYSTFKLWDFYNLGCSLDEVAELAGCGRKALTTRFRAYGLQIRPRGNRRPKTHQPRDEQGRFCGS